MFLTKWKYELRLFDLYDRASFGTVSAGEMGVEIAARARTLPVFQSDRQLQEIANLIHWSKTNDEVNANVDTLCKWGEQVVSQGILTTTRLCHIKTI